MPAAAESVRTSYPCKQSRNFTTSRRCLHVVISVLRRSGWRLNAKTAKRPPENLSKPSSPVHPSSRQRTDASSHNPGLRQVKVNGLILLGHQTPVALWQTLGRLSQPDARRDPSPLTRPHP
jgi:hypothetical protein